MKNDNEKSPWYAAGLHFECLQCGRCCSGPAEGYIWVNRPEIKLIAQHLGMSAAEVKKEFLKRVGLRTTIIENTRTHDCIFLREGRCAIYPVRPSQCRNWPFWPNNLVSPDKWNTAGIKCPGINRGELYTPQQIRARNSERWWQNGKK